MTRLMAVPEMRGAITDARPTEVGKIGPMPNPVATRAHRTRPGSTADPGLVRWALVATGFGMGPIFPTSVGLASVMAPRISGTAMSLVMGVGFAGLLLIPPAVGYVSDAPVSYTHLR